MSEREVIEVARSLTLQSTVRAQNGNIAAFGKNIDDDMGGLTHKAAGAVAAVAAVILLAATTDAASLGIFQPRKGWDRSPRNHAVCLGLNCFKRSFRCSEGIDFRVLLIL